MGPMILFTGYRTPDCDLYTEEKQCMVNAGVLDCTFLALSRHKSVPKVGSLNIIGLLDFFFLC